MAERMILKLGDSALRKKARPVEKFDARLGELIDDMIETMKKADGIGLAAPQIGVLRRVVVIGIEDDLYEFVNPQIIKTRGTVEATEGCLSIPGTRGYVPRPEKVWVRAQDRHGDEFEIKAEGLFAIACSHELDHLDGVLFIDKMTAEVEEDDD